MTKYVALLRGIMPMNPNMRGEKLREVFESLGFKNVATVIASGNVVFESGSKSVPAMETKIEAALHKQLGFKSATIIRSKEDLEKLLKQNPFKGIKDEKPNYLIVTFFKHKPPAGGKYPSKRAGYTILNAHDRALASVIDLSHASSPDFMRQVEKEWSKDITTRTWKTIHRIVKKMKE